MHWYLILTKPRQEFLALKNLEYQGYECYLPTRPTQHLRNGIIKIENGPLFPRYLFIQLGTHSSDKSWGPIRSTIGVSGLVKFGVEPAKVDERLIEQLRLHESLMQGNPKNLYSSGDQVVVLDGPFAGIDAVFEMSDGDSRVIVLIELLGKKVSLKVSPVSLRKAS